MPKRHQPALTEEERIRAQIRGLHELVQDAKETTARLKAERDKIENSITEILASLINDAKKIIRVEFQDELDKFNGAVNTEVARLIGMHNPEDLFASIGQETAKNLRPYLDSMVAQHVAQVVEVQRRKP